MLGLIEYYQSALFSVLWPLYFQPFEVLVKMARKLFARPLSGVIHLEGRLVHGDAEECEIITPCDEIV
jgi:hypothetical protein